MQTANLKTRIEAVPESFVATWTCIEEIRAALAKAGEGGGLALAYCAAERLDNLTSKSA